MTLEVKLDISRISREIWLRYFSRNRGMFWEQAENPIPIISQTSHWKTLNFRSLILSKLMYLTTSHVFHYLRSSNLTVNTFWMIRFIHTLSIGLKSDCINFINNNNDNKNSTKFLINNFYFLGLRVFMALRNRNTKMFRSK